MEPVSVIIVEDESIIARAIERTLTRMGYSVPAMASSGEECLRLLEGERPDIILMDIALAGRMDGIETSAVIREKHGIPVIYLTSHADSASLERAKMTAPYGYIMKPVKELDLVSCMEMALSRWRTDEAVRKSEAKFRLLFEQSGDAVYIGDRQGAILDVNRAMIALFATQARSSRACTCATCWPTRPIAMSSCGEVPSREP
jgi:CheY-like chemotaxis protein